MTHRTSHRQIRTAEHSLAVALARVAEVRIALVLVLVLLITSGGAG
ncbi:MAG: hypothetical protein ABI411_17035 [Tahibacter sp.]